jgi:hypothetical protein
VVDATEKDKFSLIITEGDRRKGIPNDPERCAAACALMRKFPGCTPHVHRSIIMIEMPKKRIAVRHPTPSGLRDQLIRNDASGTERKFDTSREFIVKEMPASIVASRGKQHSPPDRPRGDPNSPKKRQKPVTLRKVSRARRHVGRSAFHWPKAAA